MNKQKERSQNLHRVEQERKYIENEKNKEEYNPQIIVRGKFLNGYFKVLEMEEHILNTALKVRSILEIKTNSSMPNYPE